MEHKVKILMIKYSKNSIDFQYQKNYQGWLIGNSSDVEFKGEHYEYDEKGNITNVEFSGTTKHGFKLTEQDFIKHELKRINGINSEGLDLDESKYLAYIKGYFEAKLSPKDAKEFTTNNFDCVEPDTVKKHFQILVDKKLLTGKDLTTFLIAAFQKQTPPKEKFSLDFRFYSKKKGITKIFYSYYKDIAGKPHGKQKEYVSLLGDYFKGFDSDSLASNFNK